MPRRAPEQPSRATGCRGVSRASSVSSGALATPISGDNGVSHLDADSPSRDTASTPPTATEAQVRDLERRLQEQNHLYWESARRKEEDLQVARTEARNLQQQLQELHQKHKQELDKELDKVHFGWVDKVRAEHTELEKVRHAEETLRSEWSQSLNFEVNCVCELRQELKDESDTRHIELKRHQEHSTKSLAKVRAELVEQQESLEAEQNISAQTKDFVATLQMELKEAQHELAFSKSEASELRQAVVSSRAETSELQTVSSRFEEDIAEFRVAFLQQSQDASQLQSELHTAEATMHTAEAATAEIKETLRRNEEETRRQLVSSKAAFESEAKQACYEQNNLKEERQKQSEELQRYSNELQAVNNTLKDVQHRCQHEEHCWEEQKSKSSQAQDNLKAELNDLILRSSVDASKLRLKADEATSCFQQYEAEASSHQEVIVAELTKERQSALQESESAGEGRRLLALATEKFGRARNELEEAEKERGIKAAELAGAHDIEDQLRRRINGIRDEMVAAKEAERLAQDGREAAQQCAAKTVTELQDVASSEQAWAKAEKAVAADCQKLKAEINRHVQSHEEALAQKDADLRELRSHASRQLEKLRLSTEDWAANEAKRERDLEVANQNMSKANKKIEELCAELVVAQSKTQRLHSNEKDLKQARAEADHCARLTHSLEAQLDESREKLRRAELRQEAKGEELEGLKARSAALQSQMQDLKGKLSAERLTRQRGADPGTAKGDTWLYSESTGFFAPLAGGAQPSKSCGTPPGVPNIGSEDKSSGSAPAAKRSHSVGELPRPAAPMPMPPIMPGSNKMLPPPGGPSLRMGWATNAARSGSSKKG